MRLTRLKRHIRAPAEQERRKVSTGKVVYLVLLLLLGVMVLRYSARKALHVEGKGFIRGESAAVQALNKGRIETVRFALLDPVAQGDVVAVLGAEGPVAPADTAWEDRRRDLDAERRRLLARLQDEREQEASRRARERVSNARELDRVSDRIALLEARLARDRAVRAAEEEERERWRRLFELEAITLEEYLRRAPPESTVGSEAEAELGVLRSEERRLMREGAALSQDQGAPGGNQETLARLAVVREQLKRPAPAAPVVKTAWAGDVLRAPIGGVLSTLRKKPGEVLLAGESLGEIVDPQSLFVEAYFDAKAESHLTPGAAVRLEFDSGARGRGRIASVDRIATPLADEYQKNYEPLQTGVRVRIAPEFPDDYPLALNTKVRVLVDRY